MSKKLKENQIDYPRSLAVRVLTRVLSDHLALDDALAAVSGEIPLGSLPWLQEVCSGTLRWKGRLDSILDSIALKKKPSGWLRKILLIATYQLVVQDRTHAGVVVSETVDEIKLREGAAPANFANACLRKVADHAAQWRSQPYQAGFNLKSAAAWASMPEWLWKKIYQQRGPDWSKAYALASLERPKLWARGRTEAWSPAAGEKGPVPASWEIQEGGSVVAKAGFAEGEFLIQDISSQFLIHEVSKQVHVALGNAPLRALDLCAAPGGKSVGLAWNGFQVTATDRNENRIPLLKQSVERAAREIQVIPWASWNTESPFDLIWVDAPCSGTGILRRHPDVRWLRKEKELDGLITTQRKILSEAWDRVKPGGFLAYSVCSVLQDEGVDAISHCKLQDSMILQWLMAPQETPFGDGFWACLLRK